MFGGREIGKAAESRLERAVPLFIQFPKHLPGSAIYFSSDLSSVLAGRFPHLNQSHRQHLLVSGRHLLVAGDGSLHVLGL